MNARPEDRLEPDETDPPIEGLQRPVTRADCLPGGCNEARPCPWASCKYNLLGDINFRRSWAGEVEVDEIPQTCALDVASEGGATMEEVGDIYGVVRERIRQIEVNGIAKVVSGPYGAILKTFLPEEYDPEVPPARRPYRNPVLRDPRQCPSCGRLHQRERRPTNPLDPFCSICCREAREALAGLGSVGDVRAQAAWLMGIHEVFFRPNRLDDPDSPDMSDADVVTQRVSVPARPRGKATDAGPCSRCQRPHRSTRPEGSPLRGWCYKCVSNARGNLRQKGGQATEEATAEYLQALGAINRDLPALEWPPGFKALVQSAQAHQSRPLSRAVLAVFAVAAHSGATTKQLTKLVLEASHWVGRPLPRPIASKAIHSARHRNMAHQNRKTEAWRLTQKGRGLVEDARAQHTQDLQCAAAGEPPQPSQLKTRSA